MAYYSIVNAWRVAQEIDKRLHGGDFNINRTRLISQVLKEFNVTVPDKQMIKEVSSKGEEIDKDLAEVDRLIEESDAIDVVVSTPSGETVVVRG